MTVPILVTVLLLGHSVSILMQSGRASISTFLQGVTGNDVFDATYRTDVYSGNFPSWMLGRWTGPYTSNKYPILKSGDATNWMVSDSISAMALTCV